MIQVTRINHEALVLNSDLIEMIETTPDTVLTLANAQKLVVMESAEEIVSRVVEFRRRIYSRFQTGLSLAKEGSEGRGE